ncbi:MAG: M67 family metallopeptidase, partial [Deltaproteobacteria bacterium]|nr:M67 family metallopeptidase [Deltaproteobacteria bacterium]
MKILALVLREIREQARLGYPHECCGFVLGRAGRPGPDSRPFEGLKILPADNSRSGERRGRRFRIEPEDLLAAEETALAEGLDVVAVYHSHPDHPAAPSANDLAGALPFYRYVIVGVDGGKPGETTNWVLSDDRATFEAEPL